MCVFIQVLSRSLTVNLNLYLQENRGFFFCLEDRALLCRDCDVSIHTANTLSCNHQRFLVPGTKVALEEVEDDAEPLTPERTSSMPSPAASSISQSSNCSRASMFSSPTSILRGPRDPTSQTANTKTETACKVPSVFSFSPCCPPTYSGNVQSVSEMKVSQEYHAPAVPQMTSQPSMGAQNAACMKKSSISEFLTDAVPGWRVDEILNFADCTENFNTTDFASTKVDSMIAVGGDYDWTSDLSLFEEQMFAMHEVPQFPAPEAQLAALPRSMRAPRHIRNKPKQEVFLPNGYEDAFIVPDIRVLSGTVSPPVPKKMKRDFYHI